MGSCIHYLLVSEASARVNLINTLPECSHLRGLASEDHRNKLKAIFTVRIGMFSTHYDNVRGFQPINVNIPSVSLFIVLGVVAGPVMSYKLKTKMINGHEAY